MSEHLGTAKTPGSRGLGEGVPCPVVVWRARGGDRACRGAGAPVSALSPPFSSGSPEAAAGEDEGVQRRQVRLSRSGPRLAGAREPGTPASAAAGGTPGGAALEGTCFPPTQNSLMNGEEMQASYHEKMWLKKQTHTEQNTKPPCENIFCVCGMLE